MAKVKKYLAAFLATVMTVLLIVIPGAVGVSAATANDTVNEASNSQEGYVSFLEKSPNPVNDGTLKGASVTAQDTSNNYAFLKQLDVTVIDAASFNTAGSWFWFNGVNWQNKYDDLSQISNNGYLEFWVKATAAFEFEVRLSATYGYYTHTVKVETVGEWQKLKLSFINFKAEEYAKTILLSNLAGIKIVFGANSLAADDSVSFGSMSFYTDNTAYNGYVKVQEGEVSFQDKNLTDDKVERVDYSANGEKFSYSKKLTFTASESNNKKYFDIQFPSDISSINLGNDGYVSFWVRSNQPITTKYHTMNTSWANTFTDGATHLKTFGGDNLWKEYRIYKSELSNTSNLWRLRFYVLTGNLTANSSVSVEFSGFAVYTKLDYENNIYQAVPEKTLTNIILGGNANGNAYLAEVEVTDPNATFSTAYQAAVKNNSFYTGSNWQGAYFIYSENWSNANFNISKITTDGYIKTYIKTERPIKLLLGVIGEGYKFSKDVTLYINGSSDWQEILIPISRFQPNSDNTLPLGNGSGGDSPIPLNKIMGFRWRVLQYGKEFLNPATFDESGNYVSGETVFFGPMDFVRMIHADFDDNRTIDSKDLTSMRKALLGSLEVTAASADANGDGGFDILDLVHLKKYLADIAPITVDMSNTHTCGGGNGILVSDKNKVLPDDTVINAFRNTSNTSFSSLYASATLLDSICIEAVSKNSKGEAQVVSPTGSVIVKIPVSYLYTSKGVNSRNIASVKAAVQYNGGCKPVSIAHDSNYVYVTTDVLGDFCFYTGETIAATTAVDTSDLVVVLEEDHPGVTGYDAVYTARAYQSGVEITNPNFTTDIADITISGNTVTVPASFKDNTTVDGTKLTVTAGDPNQMVLSKRHKISPWRHDVTRADGVMTAAIGDVTNAPDSSSDFGRWYSITVGENFYTVDYTGNILYMMTTWAGNNDFSALANYNSALRLWFKTPHAATFTVKLLDESYAKVGSATVTSSGDTTDWQAIDIPVSALNIKAGSDLSKILGITLSPATKDQFLSVGETFTFGAIDLMVPAQITAYYPLMIRNWKNVVTDNFDGDSLNGNIWTVFNGNGTEQGTGAVAKYNSNALSVNNSNLVMSVVKESDGTFSIPRISTVGKYEQTYGLFSAKIKTPKNTKAGVNTAFWLLPSSGSWGTAFIGDMGVNSIGEVDIIETSPYWTKYNAQTAIHTWDKDGNKTADSNEKVLTNANITSNTEYVDVACVWTENALYFYYDGVLVRKEAIKSNSSEKVYPILSMSIAGYNGNSTWLGSFTDADVPNFASYVDSFSISK